ncbi:MAG: universal stress protein [Alcanivorax sp.]|nr:universal stress protein [Alcanivorax sp.]
MSALSPILAVLDPQLKADQPALAKAAMLARAHGLPLRVVVNGYSADIKHAMGADRGRLQAAENHIREAWQNRVSSLLPDARVDLQILWDHNAMAALRMEIGRLSPALIVVHTSEEGMLHRHLFTPRDWQLIRKAPCPVLCVHGAPWNTVPYVLAAVDPGTGEHDDDRLCEQVVSQARHYADVLEGNVNIAHVLVDMEETLILLGGEAIPDYAGSVETVREFHRDNFRQFAASQGFDTQQQVLLEGPVAPTLAQYCSRHPVDILVVGTEHHNFPERMLLGATAESVIARASTDVLVIKPEGFRSPWFPEN